MNTTSTLMDAPGALPGGHPTHPVADCARCYGDTYAAALTTVIRKCQRSGLPLDIQAVHEQAAMFVEDAVIAPVVCVGHRNVPIPRWTPEQLEFARRLEERHPDRTVVGVVVDADKHPVEAAYNFATCDAHARAGRRVIVLNDCPEEHVNVECIQRRCDTRYRIVVPR